MFQSTTLQGQAGLSQELCRLTACCLQMDPKETLIKDRFIQFSDHSVSVMSSFT